MRAQDLVNAGFYGYQGWGDAEAAADYRATGGSGKGSLTNPGALGGGGGVAGASSSGGGGLPGDLGNILNQAFTQYQQFAQPAINTLQGLKGDINAQYDKILEGMRKRSDTTSSRELGARGIPLSSTSAQQYINEQKSGVEGDVTAARLGALTNLGGQIAGIQANAPAQAISTGLSAYGALQNQSGGGLGGGYTFDPNSGDAILTGGGNVNVPGATTTSGGGSTNNSSGLTQQIKLNQANQPVVSSNPQSLYGAVYDFGRGIGNLLGLGGPFR